ncbi:MAG: hypothetical protein AB7U73_01690 [Pirellulales bacterium]
MSAERRSLVRPLALAMVIAGLLGAWAWIGDEPDTVAPALPKRTRKAKPATAQAEASPTAPQTTAGNVPPAAAANEESVTASPSAAAAAAIPPVAEATSASTGPPVNAAPPESAGPPESAESATSPTTPPGPASVASSTATTSPPPTASIPPVEASPQAPVASFQPAGDPNLKVGSIQSPLRAMQPPSGAVVPVPLEAVSPKVVRYAERLVRRYDEDQDGQLSASEWEPFGDAFRVSDLSRDGIITTDEVARRIAAYARRRTLHSMPLSAPTPAEIAAAGPATPGGVSPTANGAASPVAAPSVSRRYFIPAERLPNGLPEWFDERDSDGDGQLTLAEFSPDGRPEQALEFESFDENRDGVITSQEGARVQTRRAAAEAEAAAQAAAAQAAANSGTPAAPAATIARP